MEGIGVGAISLALSPLLLLGVAHAVWEIAQSRKSKAKRKPFPLFTLIKAPTQTVLLLAGGMLTIFGESLRQTLPTSVEINTWPITLGGVLVFGLGSMPSKSKVFKPVEERLGRAGKRLGLQRNQVLLLIFAAIFAYITNLAAGEGRLMLAPILAIVSWTLAVTFVVLALIDLKGLAWEIEREALLWTVGLFVVAFLLRAINVEGIPNTLTGDEASGGMAAVDFVNGSFDNIFGFGWFSFPAFYFYLQSLSISIFGQSISALRLTSALGGALTVAALYFSGRAFFGKRVALLASIFLAGSHFHMHFSRIGLNNIWDGFWFVLVLGLLWWGVQNKRRNAFLLAGIALGIGQYFYVSARLLYPIIFAWAAIVALSDRKFFRRITGNLLYLLLASLIVYLPLGLSYLRNPDDFWAPMQRVSVLGEWLRNEVVITGLPAWRILVDQIWTSAQAFTRMELRHWYTPEAPILRGVGAGLFMLGVALLLIRIRDKQNWLILLWLSAFVMSGALSESTPAAQRYVAAAGAAALTVGYGLGESLNRLVKSWPAVGRALSSLGLITAVALSASDALFYLQDFTQRGPYGGTNNAVAQHMVDHLRKKEGDWQVAFFGLPRMGYASIKSTSFLLPDVIGLDMSAPWGAPENPVPNEEHILYVFLPEHEDDLLSAQAEITGLDVHSEYDQNGNFLYWYFEQ